MKTYLLIFAIIFSASCANPHHDLVKEFIPGLYVRDINNEFTKGYDSLLISVFDVEAGSYQILHNSSYTQTIDKKILSPKHSNQKWFAVYNNTTKQLQEQSKGKVFTFSPEKRVVMLGDIEYRKIAPNGN